MVRNRQPCRALSWVLPVCVRNVRVTMTFSKMKCERVDKPGSVVERPFISNVCRHTPQARNPNVRRAAVLRSYLRLLRMGFSKPRRCRRAGALLPHRFSFSPGRTRGSLLFCGTDPSGRPAQPLAGILPFEARTFLMFAHAVVRPAPVVF